RGARILSGRRLSVVMISSARAHGTALKLWPPSILDRYMLSELAGPFLFGLSAFTLIFAAAQILNIGKLIANDHAPLWAAIEVFLTSLPYIIVLTLPMAMLLGTLLSVQRLSGESELTAMKAGGIAFLRIVMPLLVAGFLMSLVMFCLQEQVVPLAQDAQTYLVNEVISHQSAFSRDLTVSAALPGGGRQMTVATAYEPKSQSLKKVTLIQYDRHNEPTQIIFADRARFEAAHWQLENVSTYRFNSDGSIFSEPRVAVTQVDIGQKPTELAKRIGHDDPDQMSRAAIHDILQSGQLSESEQRKYWTTYQEKLARPFACFVFTLIALPFGMRATRGGGSASVGFGLAVAIVFVYYIVLTVFSYLGNVALWMAPIAAWLPNLVFTYLGVQRLRKAAGV
ncbi:MAG: LptF/LptG family permease, partial [Candidatus Eremiobacteraeota bacterium]|nr:LptF/LptG family permease [Candidatus Eremiobacteraeota bacterium]